MSIFEFDEEREMKLIRKDEREIGRAEGYEQGMEAGMEKGIEQGMEKGIEQGMEKGIEQGMEAGMKNGMYKSINLLVQYDLKQSIAEEVIVQKIIDIYEIMPGEVRQMINNIRLNQSV